MVRTIIHKNYREPQSATTPGVHTLKSVAPPHDRNPLFGIDDEWNMRIVEPYLRHQHVTADGPLRRIHFCRIPPCCQIGRAQIDYAEGIGKNPSRLRRWAIIFIVSLVAIWRGEAIVKNILLLRDKQNVWKFLLKSGKDPPIQRPAGRPVGIHIEQGAAQLLLNILCLCAKPLEDRVGIVTVYLA